MKNKLFTISLLVILSFVCSTAFSQGVYIKVGGGYGLGLATEHIYGGTTAIPDIKYGSFGEGINFQLGFGYKINNNIALELDGSYILGKKFEHTDTLLGGTLTTKDFANTINIMPGVVIKAPLKDVTPYTRFGMVIAIPSKFMERTSTAVTGTDKWKESGGVGLGIQGAVGMDFKVSKKVAIFAEIFGIGMSYGPSQAENTETYSGGTISPQITYSETSPFNATTLPKPHYSFSSFGLNAGLVFMFGK